MPVTCSPKTVPPKVRLLWDNHTLRGGLYHEEFKVHAGAGSLCHAARWELENLLSDMKVELADMETVKSYVEDLLNLLEESPMAERKSFIKSFVREVRVTGTEVLLSYNIRLSAGSASQEALVVPPIVHYGGPNETFAKPVDTFFEVSIVSAPSSLKERGYELR